MPKKKKKPVETRISILVPFQSTEAWRLNVWHWEHRYIKDHLPTAEIIVGTDPKSQKKFWRPNPKPFSKTAAVNNAFKRSHGDVIVILDADTYIDTDVIVQCADRIRDARELGARVWFIPYMWIYRLTQAGTKLVLNSKPKNPYRFSSPPPEEYIEGTDGSGWGRRFGALIQIMPREAYELVGGMDERFRGWGGEDIAFLIALDTLWCRHTNTPNDVLHLWHPKIVAGEWINKQGKPAEVRAWEGQESGNANDVLANKYNSAWWNKEKMLELLAGRDVELSLQERLSTWSQNRKKRKK